MYYFKSPHFILIIKRLFFIKSKQRGKHFSVINSPKFNLATALPFRCTWTFKIKFIVATSNNTSTSQYSSWAFFGAKQK